MKIFVLLLLLSFSLFSCQRSKINMMAQEHEKIAQAIRSHFNQTVNNALLDVETWMDVWVDEDDKAWYGDPALWIGLEGTATKEEIHDSMEELLDRSVDSFIVVESDHLAIINQGIVIYAFNGYLTGFRDENGPYKPAAAGTCVFVLRKEEWKLLHFNLSIGDWLHL